MLLRLNREALVKLDRYIHSCIDGSLFVLKGEAVEPFETSNKFLTMPRSICILVRVPGTWDEYVEKWRMFVGIR